MTLTITEYRHDFSPPDASPIKPPQNMNSSHPHILNNSHITPSNYQPSGGLHIPPSPMVNTSIVDQQYVDYHTPFHPYKVRLALGL